MRALLLAAGLGTRLRPLTDSIPKCLVDIGGRPLLDHWLELLSQAGVEHVLINTHHLADQVQSHVAECKYPLRIVTVYESELLGTGGTVLANREFFQQGPVVLIHADNLSVFDIRAFMRRYETRDASIVMTMMTFETDAPHLCGIVELDLRGRVVAFHEKVAHPPSNLANAAVYIFGTEIVELIASLEKPVVDFSVDVIPRLMGQINTFHNHMYHRDIGTPESLARAREDYPFLSLRRGA